MVFELVVRALEWVFLLFHEQAYPLFALMLVVALLVMPRRKVFLIALVATIVLAEAAKFFYGDPRPCTGLAGCPLDAGFPSLHSALGTLFAFASLGSVSFYLFAPLGLLIAYSRIYLGVHSLEQVVGGMALAGFVYLLVWVESRKWKV